MEEQKGYGLALGIDIVAGVLSGAAFLNSVGKFYDDKNNCMNVGQTFMAIDPIQVYGEEFYDVMERYVDTVRSSRRIENKDISLPGDNKWRNRRNSFENGIKLDITTIEKINQCLKENNIELYI
jgi:LDH2 family malate/lactate/ureidoglycolate dehydrogenase